MDFQKNNYLDRQSMDKHLPKIKENIIQKVCKIDHIENKKYINQRFSTISTVNSFLNKI